MEICFFFSGINFSLGESNNVYYNRRLNKLFYLRGELGYERVKKGLTRVTFNSENEELGIREGALSGGVFDKFLYYVGIFPELRFYKKGFFYVNAGYKFYFHQESKLESALFVYRSTTEDLGLIVSRGGSTNGFSCNFGINPRFNNWGLFLSGGYQVILPSFDTREIFIGMNFRQIRIEAGITFNFGESEND